MGRRNRSDKRPIPKSNPDIPIQSTNSETPLLRIILAIIGASGAIIAAYLIATKPAALTIEATQTAEALHTSIAGMTQISLHDATSTSTPVLAPLFAPTLTPANVDLLTPSGTPTQSLSEAIITMSNFFGWINDAQIKDDLLKSWNLETSEFQCSEPAGCDPSDFQNFWLDWKVEYKLYDCGLNKVDTAQIYYPRDSASVSSRTDLFYRRYELMEENGQLKISKAEIIQSPSASCTLVISAP